MREELHETTYGHEDFSDLREALARQLPDSVEHAKTLFKEREDGTRPPLFVDLKTEDGRIEVPTENLGVVDPRKDGTFFLNLRESVEGRTGMVIVGVVLTGTAIAAAVKSIHSARKNP